MQVTGKLSDQISARLRQDIATGKYREGQKIPPEPVLMEMFKVGRSTVREAVRDLAIAGLLRVQQGAGTTVTGIRHQEPLETKLRRARFDELNAVRKFLDKEIILLAVKHRTTKHLKLMEQWLARRKNAIEREARGDCMDADIGFHQSIAAASGNSILAELYHHFTISIRTFLKEREPGGIGKFALSHHWHEQLFEAIREKNESRAVQVLQQILDNNY